MKEYFLYDYCLLRTPVLPVESLLQLNSILNETEQKGAALKEMFSNTLFQQAIYIASKDLYAALKDWLENDNAKKTDKLLRSLHKYYSRMCTRSTPYGLFAGVTSATVNNDKTDIRFADNKVRKHSRFDMSFVIELAKNLSEIPALQSQIKFFVNNSLYKLGGKYLYVEYKLVNGSRNYTLSALSVSPYIDSVLERAQSGATINELAAAVLLDGVAPEAILAFVRGLISAQVLVSEFQPAVTGDDFAAGLLERLKGTTGITHTIESLETAYNMIQDKNASLDVLEQATAIAGKLVSGKGLEIIQTDLFFNMKSRNVNRKVIEDIVNTSYKLMSATQPFTPTDLEDFRTRFAARYEEREVPLMQALDPGAGIGYGLAKNGNVENMPLLDGIAIRTPVPEGKAVKEDGWGKLAIEKMKEAIETRAQVVYIHEHEIQALLAEKKTSAFQSTSTYIFGSILASSEQALDELNYKFFPTQLHAPFAAKLMTRFAYGDDDLREYLAQTTLDEKNANPDKILAEIVHVPEGHHANLVLRPMLRDYEIPYLCSSSADGDKQININDLMVSMREGRLILRSARLNKEIIPYLTNAHNTRQGQPVYRFLSDLQLQHTKGGFFWRWGPYGEEAYTPRVEYNNCILKRARWVLKKAPADTDTEKYVQEQRVQLRIPRFVVLAQGDNELYIDFETEFCRSHLLHELRKSDIMLYEFLHMPENCFIKDEAGSYQNEIIIPMGTRQPIFGRRSFTMPSISKDLPRHFIPGSEWLYIKIYGGNKTLEAILVEIIKPFAARMIEEKAIDQWFFIRFNDPEAHLRVRFHRSENETLWLRLLELLSPEINPFIESGQAAKILVDTYVREIERYGEETMLNSEALFFADSVAISDFLDLISGDEGEQLRWQIGLYNIDLLLEDFGYNLSEKQHLLKDISTSFFKEFSNNDKTDATRLERSLNDKYRRHYAKINEILTKGDELTDIAEALDCFKRRSVFNKAETARMKHKLTNPETVFNNLLPSYIHMTMNRLFISRQRNHELVIYHYLNKYYESQIARQKHAATQTENKIAL